MQIIVTKVWAYFGKEEWRAIIVNGISTNYEVSNFGEIRNCSTNRILSPFIDKDGYYRNTIVVNGKSYKQGVHRFVAQAFIPNPENKPEVNHKDGDKSHNEDSNLEWSTVPENIQHAYDTGLKEAIRGSANSLSHYTDKQIHKVCKLLEKDISNINISKRTGVERKYITDIKKGRRWKHIFDQYNIKKEKYPPELKEKITDLLQEKYTPRQIMKGMDLPNTQAYLSLIERLQRANRTSLNDYPGNRSTPAS